MDNTTNGKIILNDSLPYLEFVDYYNGRPFEFSGDKYYKITAIRQSPSPTQNFQQHQSALITLITQLLSPSIALAMCHSVIITYIPICHIMGSSI
jgi:hypothetical protein